MQQETNSAGLSVLVQDAQDNSAEAVFRIGDLAREFGLTLRALRFYEDRKLLIPARAGSTRLYSAEHRQRLKLILLAKRIGFSLTETEEILKVNDQETLSNEALRNLINKFKAQVSVLTAQKLEIEQALTEVDEAVSYLESRLS
ncbi:MAG: MerR family DNA-binding transcriptional regulator [Salaquimonas sp.]